MNRNSAEPAKRFRFTIGILALIALCAGCAGYRLGSSLPPGVKSIHVPAFVNRTGEPQVDAEATRATIEEFQRDGTVTLCDAASADAQLVVTVVDYKLVPLRYDRDRAKTTSEYRLLLSAELEFKLTGTGEIILAKKVQGEATFDLIGNLTSAKIEALPKAAKDLAHDIVEAVVEYW